MSEAILRGPQAKEFHQIIGEEALKHSSLARKAGGDVVEFLVTSSKQKNYLDYCNQFILAADPVHTINRYTDHTTNLFAQVNLSLAADRC